MERKRISKFDFSPSVVKPRLVCPDCDFELYPMPEHCGEAMAWILVGSYRKVEKLICQACDHMTEVPQHCGKSMRFSVSGYKEWAD